MKLWFEFCVLPCQLGSFPVIRGIGPGLSVSPIFAMNFFLVLCFVFDHTQSCSGLTVGSALKGSFLAVLGVLYGVPGMNLALQPCAKQASYSLYYLSHFLVIFNVLFFT